MSAVRVRSVRGSRIGGRRRGLTLIEGLIAIVVISVAMPPMIMAISSAGVRRASQAMALRARWLAAERLEAVLADRHSAARGWSFITSSNYPGESTIAGFPGFSRTTSISDRGPGLGAGTGYRLVSVNVTYVDPLGGSETLTMSTVVSDYTP